MRKPRAYTHWVKTRHTLDSQHTARNTHSRSSFRTHINTQTHEIWPGGVILHSPLQTIHDSTYCGLAYLHPCILATQQTTPQNTEHVKQNADEFYLLQRSRVTTCNTHHTQHTIHTSTRRCKKCSHSHVDVREPQENSRLVTRARPSSTLPWASVRCPVRLCLPQKSTSKTIRQKASESDPHKPPMNPTIAPQIAKNIESRSEKHVEKHCTHNAPQNTSKDPCNPQNNAFVYTKP